MRLSTLSPLILVSVLAGCAPYAAEPRTAKAESKLTRALEGKVAGAAINCLPSYRANDMTIIDDGTLLFRQGSATVYRNDPPGGCSRLGDGTYTLVTRTMGGSLCRGDIAQVVDLPSGMTVGSCSMGEFVPYRSAAR